MLLVDARPARRDATFSGRRSYLEKMIDPLCPFRSLLGFHHTILGRFDRLKRLLAGPPGRESRGRRSQSEEIQFWGRLEPAVDKVRLDVVHLPYGAPVSINFLVRILPNNGKCLDDEFITGIQKVISHQYPEPESFLSANS